MHTLRGKGLWRVSKSFLEEATTDLNLETCVRVSQVKNGGNHMKTWYGRKNTLDIHRDQGKGKNGGYIPCVKIFRSKIKPAPCYIK